MGRLPGGYSAGSGFPGQEAWLNHFYESPDTLLAYLPEESILTLVEAGSSGTQRPKNSAKIPK
jgi:hypothetical protein